MCAPGPAPCAVRARRRAGGAAGCGSTHTPPQGPPAGRRPARRARPRVSRDPPARGNTKDYDDKTQERPRTNKRGLEVSHHRHRAKRWPLVSTTSVHTSQTPRNRKPPRPSARPRRVGTRTTVRVRTQPLLPSGAVQLPTAATRPASAGTVIIAFGTKSLGACAHSARACLGACAASEH